MSEQDLDTRIRSLVARAVADAPSAPELERATHLEPHRARHDGHRGWWLGGGAALLAAAAAITTVVLVADTDDRISTPAHTTIPPVATTTPPTTVPAPTTVAPSPSTVPAPPVAPFAVTEPGHVAAAGPGGVTVRTLQADLVRRLGGPAAIALPVGDGRTVVQATGAAPTIWSADGATSDPVPLVDAGGAITIHDVAVVDGRPLLLFAIGDASTAAQPDRIGVFDLASASRLPLGEREQLPAPIMPSSRLHLAANGLVVGALQAGGPLLTAIPGSPADALLPALDPVTIGQAPGCEVCPRLHTVAPDGSSVAWLEGDVLMTRAVTAQGFGAADQRTLPFEAFDTADIDVFAEGLVLNRLQPAGATANARYVLWGGATSYGELEGTVATQGPGTAAGAATPELTRPTPPPPAMEPDDTTTTSTTDVPEPPTAGGLVTAGPYGVTAVVGDGTVRSLDMPAELAVGTPGGAVIFQPARTSPEDEPGDPLV
ncbi:MAG TPA: hypothetical protein VFT09_03680, partial [Ilumatobacteraceae bacterium]|nr:hypothetical protein [Ilumatobacteraceae bacterium]